LIDDFNESEMMQTMSWAYSFKNVKYPINELFKIGSFNDTLSFGRFVDAQLLQIESADDSVVFNKANKNISIKVTLKA
jgi:hypothetical protein